MNRAREDAVWYLKEGWRLFRATWGSVLTASLFFLLLALVGAAALALAGIITVVIRAVAGASLDEAVVSVMLAILMALFWVTILVCLPALSYLWYALFSKAYYPGEYQLWALFRRGFRYWPRLVKRNLWGFLIFLPLMALDFWLIFRTWPTTPALVQERVAQSRWLMILTAPLSYVFSTYSLFAALEVVRNDRPALTAWRRAFGLVGRGEWLASVGFLAGLGTLVSVVATALTVLVSDRAFAAQLVVTAMSWLLWLYLSFCQLAVWRRHSLPAGEAAEAEQG